VNVPAAQFALLLEAKQVFAAALAESDYGKKASEFEQSRKLFARLGDTCEAAMADAWLGIVLADMGRVQESQSQLQGLLTTAKGRQFKILEPPAYYWLAISNYRQNEISESNRNLRTALHLATTANNQFEMQHVREALAISHSQLGEFESALEHAGTMLPRPDVYYQSRNQYWRDKGTLADLSLKLKLFSTSFSLANERLSMARETDPGGMQVNNSLRHLVYTATAREDFPLALRYANESLQIALTRGDSNENTRELSGIHLLLAGVKSKAKDYDGALADYEKALELDQQLPEVTDRRYEIHKGKLFCFEQLGRQDEFSNELRTVLELSEDYRSTIREDYLRQAFFASSQDVFDAAAANAIQQGQNELAFKFVEESRARSLLDFVASGKSITEVEKTFAAVSHPLSRTAIQQRLPEQVQVLQYAVLSDRLAIWILTRTRFELIVKPIAAGELEAKIAAYQAAILRKGSASDLAAAGKDLYQWLIPADLAAGKEICVVPDKSLHQLAFASLVSPTGKYLIEDFSLLNAPSASVFVLATEQARLKNQNTEHILSIGNPDFRREEYMDLPDLKDAAVEAQTIAHDYEKSEELIGGDATRERFLKDFTSVDVIHFAGHFLVNPQSPGNSKLLFAGGELRSSELSSYQLARTKLVVLSACETGFERYNKSEGAIGIARTFLALGAPIVLASQWKVDSEPTKDLMIAFHRHRKQERLSSGESLRLAQLEVLRRDETKAPFYWAAFSLFGGHTDY
jgi:CHAT domain-containing protein